MAGLIVFAPTAHAAESGATLDGAGLSLIWALPFAGLLLSIALFPLLAPRFWHHHDGKIAGFWAVATLLPLGFTQGTEIALSELLHVAILEYIPFILLLVALFTSTGGIRLEGRIGGTPTANTAMLALGALLASFIGTTGAAMLLIRPLIESNEGRKYQTHIVVFFIFLVANIGGSPSGSYTFTAYLPTTQGYVYQSQLQYPLSPGDHVVNVLRYSQGVSGTVTITLQANDANQANNTASQYVYGG